MKTRKLIAIASFGGHWVQLMRLKPLFDRYQTIYVSTAGSANTGHPPSEIFTVKDFSRDTPLNALITGAQIASIIWKTNPSIIITTGAAPGLLAIAIGRLRGANCIWIDSIANCEKLSMSGRIAKYIANICLTQWEDLIDKDIKHWGRVI